MNRAALTELQSELAVIEENGECSEGAILLCHKPTCVCILNDMAFVLLSSTASQIGAVSLERRTVVISEVYMVM
jgi:hypothetical protein